MLKVYLNRNLVFINPPVTNRDELFTFFSEKAKKEGYVQNAEEFCKALHNRENKALNIFNQNVALPHSRSKEVGHQFVGICIFTQGLNYTKDKSDQKINIVFCVGSTKSEPSYLAVFADITRLLRKKEFKEELIKANVPEDVFLTVSKHSIQEIAIESKHRKRYQVVLILNRPIDDEILSTILLESGMRSLTEIASENLLNKSFKKIPFLGSYFGSANFDSRIIIGISADEEIANKLFLLLKSENIDLDEPGTGSLYMVELLTSFGAIDECIDF